MALRSATRFAHIAALLVGGAALVLASVQPAAAHRRHGGFHGGGFHGGGFHHHHHHHHHFHRFHGFAFFGTGLGYGYYPYYPYYYPYYPNYSAYYPTYYPPPTYVSPTECYRPPAPRGPGVADLYTCSGQYVGPIAVP